MPSTSKGSVYRPTVTRTRGGKRTKRKTRFYWAKYRDADGDKVQHALKLANGDGVSDKAVADELLRGILTRVEREAAGLIDNMVEAAARPIRPLIGQYIRYLRRMKYTRSHVKQVLGCLTTIVENTDMSGWQISKKTASTAVSGALLGRADRHAR